MPRQSELSLLDGDERFKQLVGSIEDYAIYMLDCAGRVASWNRGAELNKGYTCAEILGRHFRTFFVPEDLESGVAERNLNEARSRGRCVGEGWRLRKNGERFWASFVLTAMHDSTGRLIGFAKVTRDLTERKRSEDALLATEATLRKERDTLRAATESTIDAFLIYEGIRDSNGEIEDFVCTYSNANAVGILGAGSRTVPRGLMSSQFSFIRGENLLERHKTVVLSGNPLVAELQVDNQDASSPWLRVQAVKLRDGVAITISDITSRKREEIYTRHLANHDPLTGLPNRNLLQDRISQALQRARRYNHKVAVFMVDLDSFKRINDTMGHAAGDAVLVESAVRIQSSIRGTDTVIRLGGDEFLVVMTEVSTPAHCIAFGKKILSMLGREIALPEGPARIAGSLGIAIFPDCSERAEELIAHADRALYAAKNRGKNQLAIYSDDSLRCPEAAFGFT